MNLSGAFLVSTMIFYHSSASKNFKGDNSSVGLRCKRAPGDVYLTYNPSAEEKTAFISKHNELRKTVMPPASNMHALSWDDELEQLATSYSANCEFSHNPSHSTASYSLVGENLFRSGLTPSHLPNAATQAWFDEEGFYTYNTRTCQPGRQCGHYLQVVWAETTKIGCGYSYCRNLIGSSTAHLTVCNYYPAGLGRTLQPDGSVTDDLPYKSGTACSDCGSGVACINGLCVQSSDPPCDVRDCGSESAVLKCTGTLNSYQCFCRDGFQLSETTKKCSGSAGFFTPDKLVIKLCMLSLMYWNIFFL